MTRKENNKEILKMLNAFFSLPENEDIRFFQGLTNLGLFTKQIDDRMNVTGIDDPFYQESSNTLMKIKQKNKI